jgi:hypothetical protein
MKWVLLTVLLATSNQGYTPNIISTEPTLAQCQTKAAALLSTDYLPLDVEADHVYATGAVCVRQDELVQFLKRF